MKPLFILGRAKRSVSTLEAEFEIFEREIGQSMDSAVTCGDLVYWPVNADLGKHYDRMHHPVEFRERHRAALESGLLSEIVIGEIGKSMFSASNARHIDRFQDQEHLYGSEDAESGRPAPANAHDDDDDCYDALAYDEEEEPDPHADRLFFTVGAQNWFDDIAIAENTPSFGRKLLIVIGRDPEHRFLDSRTGQKLRARLGSTAGVVFNSRHEDVAVIAFEHHASPEELFERIKRFLPPRLVEDFLIVDIGVKYCTGNEPISLFGEWDENRSNRNAGRLPKPPDSGARRRKVFVEKVQRRKPRTDAA